MNDPADKKNVKRISNPIGVKAVSSSSRQSLPKPPRFVSVILRGDEWTTEEAHRRKHDNRRFVGNELRAAVSLAVGRPFLEDKEQAIKHFLEVLPELQSTEDREEILNEFHQDLFGLHGLIENEVLKSQLLMIVGDQNSFPGRGNSHEHSANLDSHSEVLGKQVASGTKRRYINSRRYAPASIVLLLFAAVTVSTWLGHLFDQSQNRIADDEKKPTKVFPRKKQQFDTAVVVANVTKRFRSIETKGPSDVLNSGSKYEAFLSAETSLKYGWLIEIDDSRAFLHDKTSNVDGWINLRHQSVMNTQPCFEYAVFIVADIDLSFIDDDEQTWVSEEVIDLLQEDGVYKKLPEVSARRISSLIEGQLGTKGSKDVVVIVERREHIR